MKKIEAIIREQVLKELCRAIEESGAGGVTVIPCQGFGHHRNGLQPRVKVEIYADDFQVDKIVKLVRGIARTGVTGDGKIAVFDMENLIRIRTGEEGENAI